MKQVVIMRGPPGSGKSTLTAEVEYQYGKPATICSADHFYYFGKPQEAGNYKFDPKLIGKAHGQCKSNFEDALIDNEDLVIVDNTNIKAKEFNWYINKAIELNYNVAVYSIYGCKADECFKSNVHGVPKDTISKMIDSFADTPNEMSGVLIDEFKYNYKELRDGSIKKTGKEGKNVRASKVSLGKGA